MSRPRIRRLLVLTPFVLAAIAPADAWAAPEEPHTKAVTAITATSATFAGVLNPKAIATAGWHFAYGNEGSCEGHVTAEGGEVTGRAVKVSTPVTGLVPGSEYTVCVVAVSGGEETVGPPVTFTTLTAAPTVDSEGASAVTGTAATLEARVSPENAETTACVFEYGPTEGYGSTAACEPAVLEGTAQLRVHARVSALGSNQTYHYRVMVENATGVTHGSDRTLTTPGAPLAGTGISEDATRSTVGLAGTVNPQGAATAYAFVYATQAEYEAALALGVPDPYTANTAYSSLAGDRETHEVGPVTADELLPNTTYHYALLATNLAGTTIGADGTFVTGPATPPSAVTGPAGPVGEREASVSGSVSPNGLATTYTFEIAASPGAFVAEGAAQAPALGAGQPVSQELSYLSPGVTYGYRLCARNADGTSCGSEQTFTTAGSPAALTAPASMASLGTFSILGETSRPGLGHPPTRAELLAKALHACAKKARHERQRCRRLARARYAPQAKKHRRR